MGEPPGERGHGSKLPSDGWFGEPRRLPRPGKSPGERPKQAPRPPIWRQQRPNPRLLQDKEVVGSVVHDQEYRNGHDLYPFRVLSK